LAAAKKKKKSQKCIGRCGASSWHVTKLEQSIFFRYLWEAVNSKNVINCLNTSQCEQIGPNFCH
jgi:hypothetical protein